jgi:hypothetical protein
MSSSIGVWVAATLTIGAFSFLYKENKFYSLVESMFIGLGAGYALVMGWGNIVSKAITPLQAGNMIALIPTLLGLALFFKLSRTYAWAARTPVAILVGMGSAVALRGSVGAELVQQIKATVLPLTTVDNLFVVLGTVGTLVYFFFTIQPRKNTVVHPVYSGVTIFGRYTMMVAFGAFFGNQVLQRVSQVIERLQFLFGTWIHLIR